MSNVICFVIPDDKENEQRARSQTRSMKRRRRRRSSSRSSSDGSPVVKSRRRICRDISSDEEDYDEPVHIEKLKDDVRNADYAKKKELWEQRDFLMEFSISHCQKCIL